MKDSEEAIEKVLAGLRDCDVPAEMERRILGALEDHASARSRSGWSRLRPLWGPTTAANRGRRRR